MRERVVAVRVRAELQHHHVGRERTDGRRDHALEREPVLGIAGTGRERQVHREPGALTGTDIDEPPCAGEQVAAGLVHRDGEDVGALVERLLNAVAVVHVDVDVGDPQAGVLGGGASDGDRGVVVDAEAGGAVAVRVVQAAGGRERALAATRDDVGERAGGGRRDLGGDLVHVRERRACRPRRCRTRPPTAPAPRPLA